MRTEKSHAKKKNISKPFLLHTRLSPVDDLLAIPPGLWHKQRAKGREYSMQAIIRIEEIIIG